MTSAISSQWSAVALSNSLHPGEVRPAQAGATDIALWRDRKGVAHATHTRCPHRGMNLAYGFVRDDNLACAYHGWQYDADGQCAYIPAHPDLPPARSICATVYPCAEFGGIVWVKARDDDSAEMPPPVPDHALVGARSVTINAASELVSHILGATSDDVWIQPTANPGITCVPQSLPGLRTQLHVLVNASDPTPAQRTDAARWACRLRDDCEQATQQGQVA